MEKRYRDFRQTVVAFYEQQGRHTLPWRNTRRPYDILVSEIMLQQTQVDRVIPKYISFRKRFPTLQTLAHASLGEVIREWQGLGYNRRARMLHACAQCVVQEHKGHFPKTYEELKSLPGIGPYTAGAIMAFAFNTAVPIIETNIRTVYMHHFFNDAVDVLDTEILTHVQNTLDTENPRMWYYALMDYGAHLKKTIGNQNVRSKHYVKQSTFKGSDRQIRGLILKLLLKKGFTRRALHVQLPFDWQRVDVQLENLSREGMITKKGSVYTLPK